MIGPLFHITTREAWDAARGAGVYHPTSLDDEGFIHLSGVRQWLATANRFYRGRAGLVLLSIRRADLAAPLRWEHADGEPFPHLYGPLEIAAVSEAFALPVAADGAIELPPELARWRHFFVPERRVVMLPAFEAAVCAAFPDVVEVVACAFPGSVYLCYGARPGREGELPLRELMLLEAKLESSPHAGPAGSIQLGPFPRRDDGSLDAAVLLDYVERLIRDD